MKRAQKLSIISLSLALFLHLLVPFGAWWFLRTTPHNPVEEPVTMVHLVTLPPEPEPEPAKPDALAEANHIAQSTPQSKPETVPNIPPPPAATAASAEPEPKPTPPQPKPVAKPAQPKPLAKKAPEKPPVTVKSETTHVAEPEKETAAKEQPEKENTPQQKPKTDEPRRPPGEKKSTAASTPQPSTLPLIPSIESLSQWDRNRRFETRSTTRDEEVVDLNTRQTRYLSYFAKVKQRIEWGWVYPAEAKRDKLSGNVGLIFTILPDGELSSVQITRSSGIEILDEAALAGVRKAAPFGDFPEDWSIKKLTIRATFEYIRRELIWE